MLQVLLLASLSPSFPPVPPPPAYRGPKGFDSPQAVMQAVRAAALRKDWVGVCRAVDSSDVESKAADYAAKLVRCRSTESEASTPDEMRTEREVFAILDKHGLTVEATKGLIGRSKADKRACLAILKDKAGFLGDMLSVLPPTGRSADEAFLRLSQAELKGLKVSGDEATGRMVFEQEDNEVRFVKRGRGWFLCL
jgi:hypothetical protein